jgi:hypothetical protein
MPFAFATMEHCFENLYPATVNSGCVVPNDDYLYLKRRYRAVAGKITAL